MKLIYADYNATSPASESHCKEVAKLLSQTPGNPSSIHELGRKAKLALEDARRQIANAFGQGEIFFTSCATEANNWVLSNAIEQAQGKPTKILLSAAEHPSLADTASILQAQGYLQYETIKTDKDGLIAQDDLWAKLQKGASFLTIIHANNETGAINPIFELAARIKKDFPKLFLHVDGVQAFGKLDLSMLDSSGIDSYAISGHKVGALMGIGALYLPKKINLTSFLHGGGQEKTKRAGTENMAGILSLAIRVRDLASHKEKIAALAALKASFLEKARQIPGFVSHGAQACQTANTINFHIDNVAQSRILLSFERKGICASSGSACSAGTNKASPTLVAMGYSEWVAKNSIRLSFGPESKKEDFATILQVLHELK